MKLKDIRKLVFLLFRNTHLVSAATGWDVVDDDNKVDAALPDFEEYLNEPFPFYSGQEVEAVKAVYMALNALSAKSITNKLEQMANTEFRLSKSVPTRLEFDDYSFWARKSYWTPIEAVLITLGLRPETQVVNFYDRLSVESMQLSKLLIEFWERYELLIAANRSGHLNQDSTPIEQLKWFKKMEFAMPEGLFEATLRFQSDESSSASQVEEIGLQGREKETLLKLVAAMSIRGYKFKPDAARNPATKDIQDDLDFLGIGLDQKTILKWVREAALLVSDDEDTGT